MRKEAKRILVLLVLLVAVVSVPWFIQQWPTWMEKLEKHPQTEVATVLKPGKSLGNFTLESTKDTPFSHQSFVGHWTLMFFGYAQCPKICPQVLTMMSEIWRSFPQGSPHPLAQFVFVSLDPESDSVDVLKPFVSQFHPDFIGLTGPKETIIRLSQASGVFHWSDPNADGSQGGPKIIDHSASILLIGPDARVKAIFSPPHEPLGIARDLKQLIDEV